MRFLLRFMFGLVAFVFFLGIIGSGLIWGYANYGIPFVDEQLTSIENDVADGVESEYPGTTVLVQIENFYYKQDGNNVYVVIETNAQILLAGVLQGEVAVFVETDVMSVATQNPTFTTYDETEWSAISSDYEMVPDLVLDQAGMNNLAVQSFIVTVSGFVIALVIRGVFKKKRR